MYGGGEHREEEKGAFIQCMNECMEVGSTGKERKVHISYIHTYIHEFT